MEGSGKVTYPSSRLLLLEVLRGAAVEMRLEVGRGKRGAALLELNL